jgi:hypothetical protein
MMSARYRCVICGAAQWAWLMITDNRVGPRCAKHG